MDGLSEIDKINDLLNGQTLYDEDSSSDEEDVVPTFQRRVSRRIYSSDSSDNEEIVCPQKKKQFARTDVINKIKSTKVTYGPRGMFASAGSSKTVNPPATQRRKNCKTPPVLDKNNNWIYKDVGKPPEIQFSEVSRILAPLNLKSTELDCFKHFVSPKQIENIKKETNRYAAEIIAKYKKQKKMTAQSTWHKWTPTSCKDINSFLAIFLHMALYPKPDIQDYWSTKLFSASAFPASVMSRHKFKSILSMLHLNDNSKYIPANNPNHDPIFKIRPFFDFLVERCRTSFYPEQNLTVDEGMCAFRGRVHFRVYMKDKPDRYGIKLYIVCDSKSGYILNFEIYSGKSNEDNSVLAILQRLLCSYIGKGHCIYMDRFYSSPTVFKYLWEHQTTAVGTVMPNRKLMPNGLQMARLCKSQMIFARNNELLAIRWKDTRDVYILTTKHSATTKEVTIRTKNGLQNKLKPVAIIDYNKNKVGVDRADQLQSYYPFKRKSLKWWKKLFFHLLFRSVVNAFILFKKIHHSQNNRYRLKDFIIQLGTQLVQDMLPEENVTVTLEISRLTEKHFIMKIPATENNKNPRRRCKVCAEKGKAQTGVRSRKTTHYYCPDCNVPLCLWDCFKVYHTEEKYT